MYLNTNSSLERMQLFFAFKVNLCPCSASASVLWNSHYERVGIAISKTYTRKMKANKAFGLERERETVLITQQQVKNWNPPNIAIYVQKEKSCSDYLEMSTLKILF